MRFLVQFSRVIVGLLFILSGLLKLNDPTGFSYKLEEYFAVFTADAQVEQDSIYTTIQYDDQEKRVAYILRASDSSAQYVLIPSKALKDSIDSSHVKYRQTFKLSLNGFEIWADAIDYQNDKIPTIRLITEVGTNSLLNESLTFDPNSSDSYIVNIDLTSYVKSDGVLPSLFEYGKKNALFFSIFVSWLEAILGIALIIGWQAKFTTWTTILVTLFFTFLTWYSWVYDKVTDCGCFGDALPMSPFESFIKNLIIGALVLILLLRNKYIKPIFSNPFGVKVLTILTIFLIGFSLYCKHFLPVVDFLHFKEGNDVLKHMSIKEGERAIPHIQVKYRYKAANGSGETIEVLYDNELQTFTPIIDNTKWKYDTILEEKMLRKAAKPDIHDFMFLNSSRQDNLIDSFWKSDKKMLLVIYDVESCNTKSIEKIKEIAKYWTELGYPFWALTASSAPVVEAFRHEHQIAEFDFHYGDGTQLKSIIRSNPGLLLFKESSVVQKQWPSTRLPNTAQIDKLIK